MRMRVWLGLGGAITLGAAVVFFWPQAPAPRPQPPTPTTPKHAEEADRTREPLRLSKATLASFLPPIAVRGNLDKTTLASLERFEEWVNQEDTALWPSIVVVQADTKVPGRRRKLQVAFAKRLSVNVTSLVGDAPTVELAGEDGANPLAVRLGEQSAAPAQPFADVKAASEAFAVVERLRRVHLVATAEPLLDFLSVEGGVVRLERRDETALSPAGVKFRLTLFGMAHYIALQEKGTDWQIQKVTLVP